MTVTCYDIIRGRRMRREKPEPCEITGLADEIGNQLLDALKRLEMLRSVLPDDRRPAFDAIDFGPSLYAHQINFSTLPDNLKKLADEWQAELDAEA